MLSFFINIASCLQLLTTSHSLLLIFILMDSYSESFGETESSVASAICLAGEAGSAAGLLLDEFNSCVPCGTGVEVAGLGLLVEACKCILVERTN
jgi:hypothetical protein